MLARNFCYGTRSDLSKNAEESRIIQFVLSSFKKDRHSSVLNQDAWDLEGYLKNPVVLYQHQAAGPLFGDPNPDMIIGKGLNIGTIGMGKDKKLIGSCQFEPKEINPLAEKIFQKVLFGSLNSTSVGFIPKGHGRFGEGEEAHGGKNETYYFDSQELVEFSIVSLPSNPDAGKRSLGSFDKKEYPAMAYALKELGDIFHPSQIEKFTANQILTLLEGKALGIKNLTDPEKVWWLLEQRKYRIEQLAEDRKKNNL
jgi:hypothetical protein